MNANSISRQGFTLPEVIVVCVIIGVLSSLGVYSYWMHMTTARDASRKIDVEQIGMYLVNEKAKTGKLPMPDSAFSLVNSGTSNVAALQGFFNERVAGNGYSKVPTDPTTGKHYGYSVTKNRQWYQLATVIEDESPWRARIFGDYKPAARNVLPSLFLAHSAPGGGVVEIASGAVTGGSQGSVNRKKFVLDGGTANLPYDAKGNPVANTALSFEQLLVQKGVAPFGTLRYRSCFEIKESGAYAGPGDYQIIGNDGSPQTEYCQGDVGGAAFAVWSTSDWSACSATCGGGTRTRSVSCVVDGITTSDGNCASAGTKPPVSEACNTQSCGYPGCDTPDITLANGQKWAACNVGATTAYSGQTYPSASAPSAAQKAYLGAFFQWGRNDDVTAAGTPTSTKAATGTLAGGVGHANFIFSSVAPFDWIFAQNNNLWGGSSTLVASGIFSMQTAQNQLLMRGPCAAGYHVPTRAEWGSAISAISPGTAGSGSWQNNTAVRTTLMLPLAGSRSSSLGSYENQGAYGYYWTSTVSGSNALRIVFSPTQIITVNSNYRAFGFSVRCLKD